MSSGPDDRAPQDTEAPACTACRGTGQVISNFGGEPKPVACPWCDGTGHRIAGHDAQAARRA